MTPKTAACCLAFLLAWTRWASAQSIILPPSKTNTLIQVVSGGTGQLSNALGDIYVGRTNQDGQGPATISIRRGLIEFNIASEIPAGSTITGVTLTVNDVAGITGTNQPHCTRCCGAGGRALPISMAARDAATNGDAT